MRTLTKYVPQGEEKRISLEGLLACIEQGFMKLEDMNLMVILCDGLITDINPIAVSYNGKTFWDDYKVNNKIIEVVYTDKPTERTKPKKKDIKKKVFNTNHSMRVKRHYDEY